MKNLWTHLVYNSKAEFKLERQLIEIQNEYKSQNTALRRAINQEKQLGTTLPMQKIFWSLSHKLQAETEEVQLKHSLLVLKTISTTYKNTQTKQN